MLKMLNKTDVVYIAGPMTGRPLYNYMKFYGLAELIRREYRCTVLNPARQPHGLPYEEYMTRAMQDVNAATVVVMMIGWSDSKGATSEYKQAQKLGKRIVAERDITRDMNEHLKNLNQKIEIGEIK